MADILKGSDVVQALNNSLIKDIETLKARGVSPTLAIVRIGEKPDDISYERNATKRCETVGAAVKSVVLPKDVTQSDLVQNITALNDDDSIHGIIILQPLPKHINKTAVFAAMKPEKDIDGITEGSLAGVFTGSGNGFAPCTARACIEILDYFKIECKGKRTVVLGRSLVVGKPVAALMIDKHATVTVCHTRTIDIPAITRNAEILIVATGNMEGLTKEYFSPGQIVIDVGIHWSEAKGKLCGDVKFDEAEPIVGAITPVPGGVGTVTTSVLVSHLVKAASAL